MNNMCGLYFLWIICTISSYFGLSNTESTCELNIDNCNYKLTLLPSNENCQSKSRLQSRSKRSEENGYEISDMVDKMSTLESEFEKLENKLVKEMKDLSKRVLRGARRIESLVESVTSKGHEKKKNRCPEGFVSYDDWTDCYMFSTFNTTWYDAREYCTAMGSGLVALGSLKEHFLVSFQIQNNPEIRNAKGWWTSGTYMTKIKKWMWMNTDSPAPINYSKWAVHEPNDQLDTNLQCIMMYKLDGLLWHDQICTDKYNFICEKPVA
ncbi:C-type lectin domain family 4 member G-like [Mercenaria mercenaria]|uniref:C-type lectin domain family 4 member G-like n=1 Tax=Mercenaria mercenaria TaxID=6596 RepID=UPI00234EF630|nr:C-type lectin domain family 4 member G-like [Mercenaria mercenaria]